MVRIKTSVNIKKIGFILFNLVAYNTIFILYLNAVFPAIGHDYNYHFPRMLDTLLHYKINGFSVQWFTPSFGGGLPVYSNPQSLQYSLPQFLMFFLNPWASVLLSSVFFANLGYLAFYRFAREILEASWPVSALGASLFMINGFFIEHLAAGHLTFQTFPLSAILLYLLFSTRVKNIKAGILIGLIGAYMIFSGGFYLIVGFGFSLALSIPLLFILKPEKINIKKKLTAASLGLTTALILTIGKLFAVYSLMRFFPRIVSGSYYYSIRASVLGVLWQILGVTTLVPVYILRGEDPALVLESLSEMARFRYIWETDISISPVLLLLSAVGVVWILLNFKKFYKPQYAIIQMSGVILLLLGAWITFEFITARGISYEFIHSLPIFSSLRVNQRFTSSLILPGAIFATFSLKKITSHYKMNKVFSIAAPLNLMAFLFLGSYFILSPEIQDREFHAANNMAAYDAIMEGETYPITKIAEIKDANGFINGASTLVPYEALFGNSLTEFNPYLIPGDVFRVDDGYFNFTNPMSYVYPEESGTSLFERIKIEDRETLERFLKHEQPDWGIPTIQYFLNFISLLAFVVCGLYLLSPYGKALLKRFSQK